MADEFLTFVSAVKAELALGRGRTVYNPEPSPPPPPPPPPNSPQPGGRSSSSRSNNQNHHRDQTVRANQIVLDRIILEHVRICQELERRCTKARLGRRGALLGDRSRLPAAEEQVKLAEQELERVWAIYRQEIMQFMPRGHPMRRYGAPKL